MTDPAKPSSREWATLVRALNLSQPDSSSCQATCIAMALGDRNIMGIRQSLLAAGEAGSPNVMASVIQARGADLRRQGIRYSLTVNASLDNACQWLKGGELLITHGWFTRSGHVICLDGVRETGDKCSINVKDPWSEFNAPDWSYNLGGKFYDGFYSDRCIFAACVEGVSKDDAYAVYKHVGALTPKDKAKQKMWVHRFTPIKP